MDIFPKCFRVVETALPVTFLDSERKTREKALTILENMTEKAERHMGGGAQDIRGENRK